MNYYFLVVGVICFILICSLFLNFYQRDEIRALHDELERDKITFDLKKIEIEKNLNSKFEKEKSQLEAEFKEKLQKPQDSYELKQFLGDLLSGSGLIEVRRVAPTDVFIRSPRSQL